MLLGRKPKQETLVVVFDSTASALAFSNAADDAGLGGRLFPVPRSLSAGCGIAWRDDPAARALAESLVASMGIDDARVIVMDLA